MQPPALERIGERRDDVFLTGKLGEGFRPPLAREDLIAHTFSVVVIPSNARDLLYR